MPSLFCFTDPARACFGFSLQPTEFSPHRLACAIHINKDAYRLLKPPLLPPTAIRLVSISQHSAGDIKLCSQTCAALTLATFAVLFLRRGFSSRLCAGSTYTAPTVPCRPDAATLVYLNDSQEKKTFDRLHSRCDMSFPFSDR